MSTGTVRIHVDVPVEVYKVLAQKTDSEVGRLLRTLATRAAASQIEKPQPTQPPPLASVPQPLGPKDAKTRRYDRTNRRMRVIRQMLGEGYKISEIARAVDISVRAVHEYQRRLAHTPPTAADRVHGIPGLHSAGFTATEIARALNLDDSVVLAYIEGMREAS
jgi:hypothetical protein